MGTLSTWIDIRLYSHFQSNWDDHLFRRQISEVLRNEDRLLDLGAGAGIVAQMNFRGLAARVCGIDPDSRVCFNPYLDESKVAVGDDIPYEDATFDVVIADNVLEHLEQPAEVFREVARVLRPGGLFLAKTPNKHHYVSLLARIIPLRFHRFVNRVRGRENCDTFPTRYRVNTEKEIRMQAARAGLVVKEIQLVEGRPEYLRLLAATYLMGWVYERLVNTLSHLARFRILIIVTLEKPLT